MTKAKDHNDWRFEFKQLIALGPVEVRMILKDVLDICTRTDEEIISTKYSEIVESLEEFEAMLSDPTLSKITSLRQVPKSQLKKRK
jgi:hypothetical protein